MPVSIPISAAGTGPSPNSSAFSAPVTQNSASPAASSTLITRSVRPERRVEEERHQPAATGHQQVAPVRQRRRRRTAPISTSRRKPPPSPVDAGQHQHREDVELLADRDQRTGDGEDEDAHQVEDDRARRPGAWTLAVRAVTRSMQVSCTADPRQRTAVRRAAEQVGSRSRTRMKEQATP